MELVYLVNGSGSGGGGSGGGGGEGGRSAGYPLVKAVVTERVGTKQTPRDP